MQLMHKTLKRRAVAVALRLLTATGAAIAAWEIDWHSADGGGGMWSTGGDDWRRRFWRAANTGRPLAGSPGGPPRPPAAPQPDRPSATGAENAGWIEEAESAA